MHEAERIVGDVAEEVHVRLDAPVVVVLRERGVQVEEAGLPADHGMIGEEVAFADGGEGEVVERVVVQGLVNVRWNQPVGAGDEMVFCAGGCGVRGRCLG